jgi:hypothetical protein
MMPPSVMAPVLLAWLPRSGRVDPPAGQPDPQPTAPTTRPED